MKAASFPVHESPPREVVRVQVNEFAEMHNPERPYQIILWEPEDNVIDDETPHGVRDLNRAELIALSAAIHALLDVELETEGGEA